MGTTVAGGSIGAPLVTRVGRFPAGAFFAAVLFAIFADLRRGAFFVFFVFALLLAGALFVVLRAGFPVPTAFRFVVFFAIVTLLREEPQAGSYSG